MEILFEEVICGLPLTVMIILSIFVGALFAVLSAIILDIDNDYVIFAIFSVCVFAMFTVLCFTGCHDDTTWYTVRVTDDTGYRTLVEEYKIVEKKTDNIYVVEKKEGADDENLH